VVDGGEGTATALDGGLASAVMTAHVELGFGGGSSFERDSSPMRLEEVGGGGGWPNDRWRRGGVVRRWGAISTAANRGRWRHRSQTAVVMPSPRAQPR
jgi:hypothetical protein